MTNKATKILHFLVGFPSEFGLTYALLCDNILSDDVDKEELLRFLKLGFNEKVEF